MTPTSRHVNAVEQWDAVRVCMLGLVLFFIFIEPNPTSSSFAEGGAAAQVEGQFLQQLLWPCLLAITCLSIADRVPTILKQYDIFLVSCIGWFFLTTLFAIERSVSLRRYIFMMCVMQAVIVLIAGIRNHKLIVYCIFTIFAISTAYAYLYIVFVPSLGVHPATGAEPQLVGLWRGQFAHKSIAGLVFAMMTLLALQLRPPALYALPLVPLQCLFAIKSGDKTILFLSAPVFLLASLLTRTRNVFAIAALAIGPLLVINSITIGSLYADELQAISRKLIGDSSFTGRTELWRVLIYYSSLHPWFGSGFQSFWQLDTSSPAVFYGGTWLKGAFYGHQSYLDILATTGVPGLAFALLFVLARPVLDLAKIRDRRNPLVAAYVTMWLLPLYQGATESILFEKTSGSWIFLLLGILGLRKLVVEQTEAQAEMPRPIPSRRIAGRPPLPARAPAEHVV